MINTDFLVIGAKLTLRPQDNEDKLTYLSYIKDMENDRVLFIDVPSRQRQKIHLKVGGQILVSITSKDAIYTFTAKILKTQLHPIVGYWVQRNSDFTRYQRRKYLRVPIVLPLECKMVDEDGDVLEIPVELRDLSAGGISLTTKEDLNKYKEKGRFFIYLEFPDPIDDLITECRFIMCRPLNPNASPREMFYVVALEFLEIDPEMIEVISRFCFKYQIELKRKGLI